MKQCIAVTEILRRNVVVDTKEAGTDGLENAIERVKEAYKAQEVILDAGDLVPDPVTGEPACFCEADWIDPDEIQEMDADFTL